MQSASSAYTFSFEPKPPPTSEGAMTRICDSGIPSVSANSTFATWGICVVDHTVKSPVEGTDCATTARGSIAFGISRGCV